ncbi:hypothetical protein CEXT_59371 [Caerostris extrusa]|uniref:Uncharacterized protein n=1 Tax=Caerostris extrusa TaxID=172846 RepID=A0AAV4TZB0_CAEEX|nr:hypothetical protein CEXT_59371 [Caerostris extrusa]
MLHCTLCGNIFRRRPRFRFAPSCFPDIPQSRIKARDTNSVLSELLILQITHSANLFLSNSMVWIIERSYCFRQLCVALSHSPDWLHQHCQLFDLLDF